MRQATRAHYLSAAQVEVGVAGLVEIERKKLPRYPIPCFRVGRLAVTETRQGQGGAKLRVACVLECCLNARRDGPGETRHLPSEDASSRRTLASLPCQYRNLYHACMKTTLDINDQLLAEAKALAARQRTSLTRLIEEGLQLRLRPKGTSETRRRVRLPAFKGRGGLVAGVDPLSNRALLEALGDDA